MVLFEKHWKTKHREVGCGPMVWALGLHVVALGSYPINVLTSGLDLFLFVPYSTVPLFVNSQLVASCQLGFLIVCFC